MDAQKVMDLVVLTTSDENILALFETNRAHFENGCGAEHEVIMHLIVQAIDNTYGIGSFDMYKDTGILPSAQ